MNNEYENHHNLLVNFDTSASLNLVKITFLYIFHSIGSIVLHQEVIQKNLWVLWVQPELLDLTPPPLYHRYTITLKQLYVIYNNIYLWRVYPTSDTCRSCCLTSWPAAQSTTCCLRWRSPAPPNHPRAAHSESSLTRGGSRPAPLRRYRSNQPTSRIKAVTPLASGANGCRWVANVRLRSFVNVCH